MNHQDEHGGVLVCTVTKAEREAQESLPPVHFVRFGEATWDSE